MRWDYRVIKGVCKDSGRDFYVIKEAEYDAIGAIISLSEDPVFPIGGSYNELQRDFKLMQRAFKKKVIDENNFILGTLEDEEFE